KMRTANNGHSHGGYYRRRWTNVYVPMAIIALVCGCGLLLGVVGLQRLKERRLLDRLIKEKDGQILSLHLLLQKEKDHSQEIKRKTEEMRTKMYNLRARNTDLNARISSMQSAISSLKDEQRAIELHLHETQNEAKSALIQTSRRKESEIEDLKNQKNEHKRPANFTDVKELSTSNQETGASENGAKMEIQENAGVEGFRFRGKQSFLRRTNGKRWKKITEEGIGNYQDENRDAVIMTGSSNTQTTEESPPRVMKIENNTKPMEASGTNEDPDDVRVENFRERDRVGTNTNTDTKSIGSREEEEEEDRMDESDF
ncbi:micronuclear linker histone polyprotein, partial [Striga asiatica]